MAAFSADIDLAHEQLLTSEGWTLEALISACPHLKKVERTSVSGRDRNQVQQMIEGASKNGMPILLCDFGKLDKELFNCEWLSHNRGKERKDMSQRICRN